MKVALIYYSNMDFGGAERRLTRIYNEIGKTVNCDLLVRGCKKKELLQRMLKSDSSYDGFNNIICFDNNAHCIIYILKERYNVVHCFDTSGFNAFLICLLSFLRCRTIVTVASVPIAERFQNKTATLKDKIIACSATVVDVLYPWCYEYISKYRPKKDTRITIGTFTDTNIFKPAKKDKILVYAAARLENIKNPGLLIEACNIVQNTLRNHEYTVFLLGKGELEDELRASIIKYGIQDIVEMPGYKKTSEYFPNAEAVFSLQKNENYPSQVIAEACACGCYLFITDVGSSRMCANEEFCTFVESNSVALGKAIEEYVMFPQERKNKIAVDARDYASKNYAIDNSIDYYKSLL